MKAYRTWSIYPLLTLVISLSSISQSACHTKKKAEQEAALEKSRQIERAKGLLQGILNDSTSPLEKKEATLQEVRDMQLTDPEVLTLIAEVEKALSQERAELEAARKKKANEEAEKQRLMDLQTKLNGFFEQIASAPDHQTANKLINEALSLFANAQVPVLTIIAMNKAGLKDYDRPSTIAKYLDYLKDQKQHTARIHHLVFNEAGKITELELIK